MWANNVGQEEKGKCQQEEQFQNNMNEFARSTGGGQGIHFVTLKKTNKISGFGSPLKIRTLRILEKVVHNSPCFFMLSTS